MGGTSQFEEIKTGNGMDRDLAATTNNRLELTVVELQNLQKNNTKQTEKLGGLLTGLDDSIVYLNMDIKSLITTITEANVKNDKLQKLFLLLTLIGLIFTATGLVQVWDILARGIGR